LSINIYGKKIDVQAQTTKKISREQARKNKKEIQPPPPNIEKSREKFTVMTAIVSDKKNDFYFNYPRSCCYHCKFFLLCSRACSL
jgi:hypothetical protein